MHNAKLTGQFLLNYTSSGQASRSRNCEPGSRSENDGSESPFFRSTARLAAVKPNRQPPVALTIAGSDSGGGAGIQADLKTFASLGVHGTSAITCITAQNPTGVSGIQACSPAMVRAQIDAVCNELRPAAVKTGMLYSLGITRAVVEQFSGPKRPPLVVDPVMVATSGAKLLKNSVIRVLTQELLPLATLATPNLDETSVLLGGTKLTSVEDMRLAARRILEQFGCAVLVKGGHLRGMQDAVDVFYDGKTELLLTAPFIRGVSTHGTGCTYSAAITAYLALGHSLIQSVQRAKEFISQAVACSYQIGRHHALNSFWATRRG
jgi:hydroxymethylpyrimidine/phosphomethylpyrimidine kinase